MCPYPGRDYPYTAGHHPIPCWALPLPCWAPPLPCSAPPLPCHLLPLTCWALRLPWQGLPLPCWALPLPCQLLPLTRQVRFCVAVASKDFSLTQHPPPSHAPLRVSSKFCCAVADALGVHRSVSVEELATCQPETTVLGY